MQCYDQSNCFKGALIQPGGSAEGELTLQGHKRAQQTRRVKAWIYQRGAGDFYPPHAQMILNKAVRTAPGQFKKLKVVADNVPQGNYRILIEVVGNKNLRDEAAGLMAWPFPELPLDTSDDDLTEEDIGEGDDTADE